MDQLCFCHVPVEKRQLALCHAQLFLTFHQEGVQDTEPQTVLSRDDIIMLLNFFRCNGPRLTRYKRHKRRLLSQ